MSQFIPFFSHYDGSLNHRLYVWAGSFFLDIALLILVYILSMRLKTFINLPNKHKVFWCLTGVRAIFGIHSVIFCALTMLKDLELLQNVVHGRTLSSDFFMARIVGFFIFECSFLFLSDIVFKTFNKGLAIHHTLSLIGYIMGSYLGQGHFFGILGIIMEMSTPATSVCWMMIQAKLSKHLYWKINQHFLIFLFNSRQSLGFYGIYQIFSNWDFMQENMNTWFQYIVIANCSVVTLFLNPYWTYKKTIQLANGEDWNFSPRAKPKASAFPIISAKEAMKEETNIETENLKNMAKQENGCKIKKVSNGVHKNGKTKLNGIKNGSFDHNKKIN